ncbi:hypothetical protein AGMMS50268_29460 [Spirochaetia bacterium]|nr:hypothetical protein AGMMS50268_29460 [Spirochaetia bacterium]
MALAIAATDDRECNRWVSQDAKAAGIPVNAADDPELCTFYFPTLDMAGIRAICFGESAAARARELGMEVLITEDAGIEEIYNGSPLCRQGLT